MLGKLENPYLQRTQWGWVIDPVGFRLALNKFYDRYQVPLFVTENGLGARDVLCEDKRIHDDYRIDYLRQHIRELKKAVEIDGASFVQKTMYVTIPMMKSTISTVAVLIITGVFKIFEIVQQTTGGGPNHLSETLVTYSYSMTFNSGDYGYGMSLATFTFLLSLVITGIYSILTRERGE